MASLLLRVDAAHHDEVLADLTQWREISYVSSTLGSADICAQVIVGDQTHLAGFLRRELRTLRGVINIETYVETEVHKLRFASLGEHGVDDGRG